MLENLMEYNAKVEDYVGLNDRLCYVDYVSRNFGYTTVSINPMDAYRLQGNLYAVFASLGVDPNMYVYAMYVNGYTNPMNYEGKKVTFKIPTDIQIPDY